MTSDLPGSAELAVTVQDAAVPPELPFFSHSCTVHYLNTESAVNSALSPIVDGVVGLDTEFVKRTLTPEEKIIDDTINLVIQRAIHDSFLYAWDNMGLRLVQVAAGNDVWVINLGEIRAYPRELRRILTSTTIVKVGVGILSDITVVWNDLRSEVQNSVDCGLMARLVFAEKHPNGGFNNLSLVDCAAEVLGCRVDKSLQVSDWTGPLSVEQVRYAGTDAVVSLRLYERLTLDVVTRAAALDRNIPVGWYGFNSRMGEPIRLKKNVAGAEVSWSTKDCPWFFGGRFQGYYP
ncbi:ribonuclease H-like domain-containing protein [Mycena metata]|uniref:3'-5' exonuclease n=1 Tax=Mycena metata TaxID=1033252 RepID=A0AAD7IBP7_9AGAR|nr:ribonuclease H-like domain-containing protein [Mycena metata]